MTDIRAFITPATFVEFAGWWAMLVGMWLLTLSSFNTEDFVVAAGCAVPCAVAALMARAAFGGRWSFRMSWLGWSGPLARSALVDAVRVLSVALRHPGAGRSIGHLVEVPLPEEAAEALAAGRESAAELTLSMTPGSFVVHGDPDRLVVHSLLRGEPALARTVTK